MVAIVKLLISNTGITAAPSFNASSATALAPEITCFAFPFPSPCHDTLRQQNKLRHGNRSFPGREPKRSSLFRVLAQSSFYPHVSNTYRSDGGSSRRLDVVTKLRRMILRLFNHLRRSENCLDCKSLRSFSRQAFHDTCIRQRLNEHIPVCGTTTADTGHRINLGFWHCHRDSDGRHDIAYFFRQLRVIRTHRRGTTVDETRRVRHHSYVVELWIATLQSTERHSCGN
mmetsp:Transcript_3700/g.16261  ORF Transcript_3700/g.16261 Transcript_3700/m.16261 type:complete len:228 (+) Transcript_3700:397-1080(+)